MSFMSAGQTPLIAQSQVSDAFASPQQCVENGGLFSREECKNLAKYTWEINRKIIESYDGNGDGVCETM